jgi:hypothetical protein
VQSVSPGRAAAFALHCLRRRLISPQAFQLGGKRMPGAIEIIAIFAASMLSIFRYWLFFDADDAAD